MASFTALATVSTGDPWTASDHNTYIKDNFTYVKDEGDDHHNRMRSAVATALTIATGVVTVNASPGQGTYQVEGESGANDDLATISGGATGDIIILKKGGEEITLVSTGNIDTGDYGDLVMTDADHAVTLIYDGTNWIVIGTNVLSTLSGLSKVGFGTVYDNGVSGTAKTIDWTEGNYQELQVTGNACDLSLTDPAEAGTYTLFLTGDGTLRTNIDADHDADCDWLDDAEPLAYGSTNAEIIGILTFKFNPDLTPKYVVAGLSLGA